MYVEHHRVLESFSIGGHPLIPGDGLSPIEDLLEISVQPTSRLGSGDVPEGRSRVANPVFGEVVDNDQEGSCKKGEGEKPNHLTCRSERREGFI